MIRWWWWEDLGGRLCFCRKRLVNLGERALWLDSQQEARDVIGAASFWYAADLAPATNSGDDGGVAMKRLTGAPAGFTIPLNYARRGAEGDRSV